MAALRAAKAIDRRDKESAHAEADDALCEFLRSLGHDDMVELYLSVDKWYA